MSERLVRQVALAALRGEVGDGGWIRIAAPKATDKEISLGIMEAAERGLVTACDCSCFESSYPEWKLTGPTGRTERFVRDTRLSKKMWAIAVAMIGAVVTFLAWLVPIVVGYLKK